MNDRHLARDSPVKFSTITTSLLCLLSSITIPTRGQLGLEIKTLPTSVGGRCAQMEERGRVRNEIRQSVNEDIVALYSHTCNGTPGWRKIIYINMTDTSYSCPAGLNLTSYSKRTCGRSHLEPGCSSTTFDVGGILYSQVCGRIKGYQFGATSAFGLIGTYIRQGINGLYVEGVSLTHGRVGNREHIWTFAAGLTEAFNDPNYRNEHCPCDRAPNEVTNVPSFVGNDYFCESGEDSHWNINVPFTLFADDPLWDGQNCADTSTCCDFNNPPWFTKTLDAFTNDDIELRICATHSHTDADVLLELIELYVQ